MASLFFSYPSHRPSSVPSNVEIPDSADIPAPVRTTTLLFMREKSAEPFVKATSDSTGISNSSSDLLNLNSFDLILDDLLFKIYLITKYFIIGLFKYPIWILLIVSLLLNKLNQKEYYIIYFGISSIVFIYSIYLFSGSQNLVWHLSGSLDRLMFHLSGFFMLFIAYRLKYFFKFFIK